MLDIIRLQHDREYWDEIAPEGALWYAPDTDLWYEAWFRVNDADVECMLHQDYLYGEATWETMKDIQALGQQRLVVRPAEIKEID
jgi:hypothetical protein